MRNPDDWCDVYILDGGFNGFYRRNYDMLPPYFLEALTQDFDKMYGLKNKLVKL